MIGGGLEEPAQTYNITLVKDKLLCLRNAGIPTCWQTTRLLLPLVWRTAWESCKGLTTVRAGEREREKEKERERERDV
jgi:hypothetical protein